MSVSRCSIASPLVGLCSIALTLSVWAWIRAQPPASFHDQGGMTITLICFPLTLLGWLVFGGGALLLGAVGLFWPGDPEHPLVSRVVALSGVEIALVGLALSLGTLAVL